jgi:hypothetical protein
VIETKGSFPSFFLSNKYSGIPFNHEVRNYYYVFVSLDNSRVQLEDNFSLRRLKQPNRSVKRKARPSTMGALFWVL